MRTGGRRRRENGEQRRDAIIEGVEPESRELVESEKWREGVEVCRVVESKVTQGGQGLSPQGISEDCESVKGGGICVDDIVYDIWIGTGLVGRFVFFYPDAEVVDK